MTQTETSVTGGAESDGVGEPLESAEHPQEQATTVADESASIVDVVGLFRFSGMVDSLRDTSAHLVASQASVDETTLHAMEKEYASLRERLIGVLSEKERSQAEKTVPVLEGDVTLTQLFYAAAQLSRWMDMVHQTPGFLVAQMVNQAGQAIEGAKAQEALVQVSRMPGRIPVQGPSVLSATSPGMPLEEEPYRGGQYL